MPIREWPAGERPREKLIERGPSALSDAELLAVIIGSGTRGRSAVDIGRDVLTHFGSLRHFLTAERAECLQQLGIGPARFAMLHAALELARRHHFEVMCERLPVSNLSAAESFLRAQLADRKYEVFCCLHLDTQNRLIAFEELFRGTLSEVKVYTREIARQAMIHNSASLIVAHNHPSGRAEPSSSDCLLTRQLQHALEPLRVRVLDHIVIGSEDCVSFAARGLLRD